MKRQYISVKSLTSAAMSIILTMSMAMSALALPQESSIEPAVADQETVQQTVSSPSTQAATEIDEDEGEGDDDDRFVPGYIRIPNDFPAVSNGIDYSDIRSGLEPEGTQEDGESVSSMRMDAAAPAAYPAGHDGDWLGTVMDMYPSTRDQHPYGTCWAFASTALTEFDAIAQGEPEFDGSELHLVYWSYTQGTPSAAAGDTGDEVQFIPLESPNFLDAGGNFNQAVQTLMRARGVAAESTAPYTEAERIANGGTLPAETEREDVYRLNNAYEINIKENPEQVKEAIMAHGAVGAVYYSDQRAFYNAGTNSYCDNLGYPANHAITVVGWDDAYPADNFLKNSAKEPLRDGAWLIRNSWSTDVSASYASYFWLSYEDKSLEGAWVFEVSRDEPYDNMYYYDSQIHAGVDPCPEATAFSNVYTTKGATESQLLEAVSFELSKIPGTATDYRIEVYKGLTDGTPESGTLIDESTTTGTIAYKGYYTIKLTKPVMLHTDETFAVVVSFSDPDMKVAIERSSKNRGIFTISSSYPGQSYVLTDRGWEDTYNYRDSEDEGNLIIAALASDVSDAGSGHDDIDKSALTLSRGGIEFTEKDEVRELTAKVWNRNGRRDTDAAVTFTIDDPSVAELTVNGQTATVRPKGNGTASITVTSGRYKAICKVRCRYKVKKPKVSILAGDGLNDMVIPIGTTFGITTDTKDADIYYCMMAIEPNKVICETDPWPVHPLDEYRQLYDKYEGQVVVDRSLYGTGMVVLEVHAVADDYEESDPYIAYFRVAYNDKLGEWSKVHAQPESGSTVKPGDSIRLYVDTGDDYYTEEYYRIYRVKEFNAPYYSDGHTEYTEPIVVPDDMAGKEMTIGAFSLNYAGWESEVYTFNYTVEEMPDDPEQPKEEEETDKPRIWLSADSLTLSRTGENTGLLATVYDGSDKEIEGAAVSFTVDDPGIASIDGNGVIKGLKPGQTLITAAYGDAVATCTVDVRATVRFHDGETLYKEYDNIRTGTILGSIPDAPSGGGEFICWTDTATGRKWNPDSPVNDDMDITATYKAERGDDGQEEDPGDTPEDPGKVDDTETTGTMSPLSSVPDMTSGVIHAVKGQTFNLPEAGQKLESTDKKVVTLTKAGKVTAKGTGTAQIRDTAGKVLYTVIVVQPVLCAKNITLLPGEACEATISTMNGGDDLSAQYPVFWISSAPSIAVTEAVDGGCRIHGVSKGNATVTAYVNGKAYTMKVKVNDTKNVNLTGTKSEMTLMPMQAVTLKLWGGSFRNAVWESSRGMNTSGEGAKKVYYDGIVHITASGKLTAVGSGTTTLYCRDRGIEVDITVPEPATRSLYIAKGKKQALKFAGVNSKAATWTCVDGSGVIDLAAVTKDGTVKAFSAGQATVTCTYDPYGDMGDGFVYRTEVFSEDPALETGSGLTQKGQYRYAITLAGGEDQALTFVSNEAHRVYQPVVFKSNRPDVAYIDEKGVLHAFDVKKNTTARLTCRIDGRTLTIDVTVS